MGQYLNEIVKYTNIFFLHRRIVDGDYTYHAQIKEGIVIFFQPKNFYKSILI